MRRELGEMAVGRKRPLSARKYCHTDTHTRPKDIREKFQINTSLKNERFALTFTHTHDAANSIISIRNWPLQPSNRQ